MIWFPIIEYALAALQLKKGPPAEGKMSGDAQGGYCMGFVVSVPLAWTIVLGIAATSPEKIVQGQPDQQNDELVKRKIRPHAIYKQIKYERVAMEK